MKNETPLEFFYRLNAAAGKAYVIFARSVRSREQHIKRFVRKLTDSDIETSLKSQLFRSGDDLESVLKQHEEEWRDDDRPTPRQRDFRTENTRQGHFRPMPAGPVGRAYVAQGDTETDDEEKQVRFLDEVEEYEATPTQALVSQDPREEDASSPDPAMTPDQVSNLVYRAM
jgi:hypothetical protein